MTVRDAACSARCAAGGPHLGVDVPASQQAVAARSALRVGFYRPGRYASQVDCPLLVLAYSDDGVALPGSAVRAGERAPRGELVRLPGGHYAAYTDGHEQAVEVLLSFLQRHLLDAMATDVELS